METRAPLLGEPLAVELMNTIWADRDGVHDALAQPDEAVAWLAAVAPRLDLPTGDAIGAGDRSHASALAPRLRRLRDALRRLAAEATGDDRPAATSPMGDVQDAVDAVNHAAGAALAWSTIEWRAGMVPTRVARSTKAAPETAVSQIANAAVALLTGPERTLLRACHAPGCVLYFLKAHPRREWCSAACGNRARVARHYQRHAHPQGTPRA